MSTTINFAKGDPIKTKTLDIFLKYFLGDNLQYVLFGQLLPNSPFLYLTVCSICPPSCFPLPQNSIWTRLSASTSSATPLVALWIYERLEICEAGLHYGIFPFVHRIPSLLPFCNFFGFCLMNSHNEIAL